MWLGDSGEPVTDLTRFFHTLSPTLNRPAERRLHALLSRAAARISIAALYLVLPVMPLLAALLFVRWRFAWHYVSTLRKMRLHVAGLSRGPMEHYFRDVVGRAQRIPEEIHGSCVQCGNCCMNRQCAFLEAVDADKYQCGIYHSPLRRFSNCGSFPLSQHDIERYACPSYYATPIREAEPAPSAPAGLHPVPVRIYRRGRTAL
jgi:hypothetical protein